MTTIDLNADLGEGETTDAELLAIVSSCNVACGGHAGDAQSMSDTVGHALASHVAVGAHPSYPDRESFGRSSRYQVGDALQDSLVEQMRQLKAIADTYKTRVAHMKPHGALYNDAADDLALSRIVVTSLQIALPGAALYGLPDSALATAAAEVGVRFIGEGFVDRAYQEDGRLVPRSEPDALHVTSATMAAQAIALHSRVDTLCIHGDTPCAVTAARAVRTALEDHGVEIRAVAG